MAQVKHLPLVNKNSSLLGWWKIGKVRLPAERKIQICCKIEAENSADGSLPPALSSFAPDFRSCDGSSFLPL